MTHDEMARMLAGKLGVALEEAAEALEACGWDLLDAALMLERGRGGKSRPQDSAREAADEDADPEQPDDRRRGSIRTIGRLVRGVLNLGNRNRFEVRRGEELVVEMPLTVLVLLLVFAFWVCVALLAIGLFAGCRYAFNGAELGREGVNRVMNRAADAAQRLKDEVTGGR